MAKSDPTPMPRFDSILELVEFFDTQDLGDYWKQMPEAHFEVDIQRKSRLVVIEEELISQLADIAKSQQVSTEDLIHSWLKEKVARAS